MENQLVNSVVTVLVAIIGVAIVALLISPKAQTSNVITSGARGFSDALSTALSPVTGSGGFGGFNSPGGSITSF